MLRVDRAVRHRGVEPQSVALLAVVERALEGRGRRGAARASATTAATAAALRRGIAVLGVLVRLVVVLALGGLLGGGLGGLLLGGGGLRGLLLGAARLGLLELGGDQRIVFRAEIDLVVEVDGDRLRAVLLGGGEVVLALEGVDLLDGDLELVCDPCISAPLAHPGADLVQVGLQRASCHRRVRLHDRRFRDVQAVSPCLPL